MTAYLVTGAAGFIGAKVAQQLLDGGERVVGIDDMNDAYDVRLKEWRLERLLGRDGFEFRRADMRDRATRIDLHATLRDRLAGVLIALPALSQG